MSKPSLLARVPVSLVVLVAVLGVGVVCIAVSPIGTVIGSMIQVTLKHRNLKNRSDAHEIGREMAAILRDSSLAPNDMIYSNDKRMPERLRELNPVYFRIGHERRSAMLEFGGGFYHYGYTIIADGSDEYRMTCYGENEDDFVELGTFKYQQGEQGVPPNGP